MDLNGDWKAKPSPIVEPKNMSDEELLKHGFTQEAIDAIRHRTASANPPVQRRDGLIEIAGETTEDRLIRLCHIACIWAEVDFCGVRDGLCYFEACYTELEGEPLMRLSVSTEGLTMEQMIRQIGAEIERNTPCGEYE